MLSKFVRTSMIAACLTAVTAMTAGAAEPVPANAAGHHYRAKQVLGTKIMIQGETQVGTVDDLVFDDAGNLEYLIVDNGGKLITVPFEAARFNIEKRIATLTITPDQYKVIPTYTREAYPAFYAPAYRTETYKFYGVTPRELRRIERRNP